MGFMLTKVGVADAAMRKAKLASFVFYKRV